MAGRCHGSGKIKGSGGEACSPPRQRFGDGFGDGEAAVAEIDADGRASVAVRVARSGGGRRGPGHGILVQAEREAREDARRPMRCSPTTRSFVRPAMAWRLGFTVAAPVERVWEAQVSEKGSRRGSRVCFIG
jgi:hypothetical protein